MHDDRWPGPTAIVDINVHDQEGSIINRTTRSNTQHTEIPIRDAVKTSNESKTRIIPLWPYENQLIDVWAVRMLRCPQRRTEDA